MEEKTLLQQLIDGEIDTQTVFGEKTMSRDPYRLFVQAKSKLTTIDTQKSNWQTLKNDCINILLGEFTEQEINAYLQSQQQ